MKVMVIVKASAESEAGQMPSQELLTAMGKYNEQLVEAGIMQAGEGLHPSSKGKRVRFSGTNRTVIDGPFAETKELIAGFWMWNVKSMDEAVEWLKRCPNPHDGPSEVELRQVFSADDFGAEFTPELREQEAGIRAKGLGLGTVKFENRPELTVAGLNESYTNESRKNIPLQWQRFSPHLGKVPGQVGKTSYGVCWKAKPDCGIDYLSGVEVSGSAKLPADFTRLTVPAHRYAIFTHSDHISTLPKTIAAIMTTWAPDSGVKIAQAPMLEVYSEKFDAKTGQGGVEIWLPIEA